MNRFAISILAVILLGTSSALAAEPTKDECIAANESAQDLRQAGKLREARQKLTLCLAASCPGVLREDCAQRLTEIDKAMPAIVFEAKDGAGNDLSAVRVTMDGQPLVARLDGSAIPVDPGRHTFALEGAGLLRSETTLALQEGERDRHQRVVLSAVVSSVAPGGANSPQSVPPETSPRHRHDIRALAYVALGVGAVGFAVGIGTGIAAGDKHAALRGECTPYPECPSTAQGDLDGFHSLRTWSTAGYVVGALGVVGGAVLWFAFAPHSSEVVTANVWVGPTSAGLAGAF